MSTKERLHVLEESVERLRNENDMLKKKIHEMEYSLEFGDLRKRIIESTMDRVYKILHEK